MQSDNESKYEHKQVRVDGSGDKDNPAAMMREVFAEHTDWQLVTVIRIGDGDYRLFFTRKVS